MNVTVMCKWAWSTIRTRTVREKYIHNEMWNLTLKRKTQDVWILPDNNDNDVDALTDAGQK